jgi:predicted acyltransferase
MPAPAADGTERAPPSTAAGRGRLLSVDALRGFDMLLISGGGGFLVALSDVTGLPWVDWLAGQMSHPPGVGFSFYDCIFPLFLFIAGVALPFSSSAHRERGAQKRDLYRKSFVRMLVLIGLGILYKNAPLPFFEPGEIRVVSVLGRIGIATFVATLLYLNSALVSRLAWAGAVLVGYYAALFLVPVPGYGAGDLSIEGNLAGWIDRALLPGRLRQGSYDELGLLTQLPALCLTIFGTVAGDRLRSGVTPYRKVAELSAMGAAGIAAGLAWGLHFPINKHLWSSSFILLTGGMALVTLALFYLVIDVLGERRWAFFFQVIGTNSLAIYLGYRFVDFSHTSRLLFGGVYAPLPEPWHLVCQEIGAVVLVWLFLYALYRNRLFLKL